MKNALATPTLALIAGLFTLATPALLSAQAPPQAIPIQGRLLKSDGTAASGPHTFDFQILSGTTVLYDSTPATGVPITLTVDASGLYSLLLGSDTKAITDATISTLSNLTLHVTIDGTPMAPDEALEPLFQARSAWFVNGAFGGDVTGTQSALSVGKLLGIPLDPAAAAPGIGQTLVYNGNTWAPAASNALEFQGLPAPAAGTGGVLGHAATLGPSTLQGYTQAPLALPATKETNLPFGLTNASFVVPTAGYYQFRMSVSATATLATLNGVTSYPTKIQPRIKVTNPVSNASYKLLGPIAQYLPMSDLPNTSPVITADYAYTGAFNANDIVTFFAFLDDANATVTQETLSAPGTPTGLTVISY